MTTAHAPASGLRLHLADLFARLGRVPLSIHQLLFRLAIAGVFLRAGLTKIGSWESTVALFADEYKVPVLAPHVAAALSATFELVRAPGVGLDPALPADAGRRRGLARPPDRPGPRPPLDAGGPRRSGAPALETAGPPE
jgi:hypothetical protein